MVATVVIGTSQQQEIIFYLLFLVQTQYKQTMQTVLQHENMYTSVNNPPERMYWQLAWRLGTYSGT